MNQGALHGTFAGVPLSDIAIGTNDAREAVTVLPFHPLTVMSIFQIIPRHYATLAQNASVAIDVLGFSSPDSGQSRGRWSAVKPTLLNRFNPETLAGFLLVGHYLSASWAASMPAWAQVSSWSAVPPLTPIAPICTLSAVMIGNPPANAIMPGTSASPGTIPPLRSLP